MNYMEITFTRPVRYSLILDEKMIKALRKRIIDEQGVRLPMREFMELIEYGQLLDEHEEGLSAYVMDREDDWEVTDGDDIESIEIA